MKYDAGRAAVLLSVGELCARALTPPDLDLRPGSGRAAGSDRAALGREAHRLLQKRAAEGYEAEVTLTNTTLYHGLAYEVSGRADGVLRGERTLVEEIKTVGAKAYARSPSALHEAQAMCYAWFLCRQEDLDEIDVRLTLYRVEDGSVRSFQRTCTAAELQERYFALLSRVEYFAEILKERETVRLPSVQSGRFPFPSVRQGQDMMIRECYRDIRAGKRLFVQAPTGTGKTVSALYPAVRALGDGYCDRIFYLTAKASTRREAYQASAQIFEAGSRLRTIVLTSREQLCANPQALADPAGVTRHCNPESCPRARGFYERCREAVGRLLGQQSGYPRSSVAETAAEFGICPYEFQLELSELCDVIICDYNYVFDPSVYLRRYFEADAVSANRYVFLVDEAHNLGDRTCDMYSAELRSEEVGQALRAVAAVETAGAVAALDERFRPLEELNVALRGLRRLCRENFFRDEQGNAHGFYLCKNPLLSLIGQVAACRAFAEKWLYLHPGQAGELELLGLLSALRRFEAVAEAYEESYFVTFVERNGAGVAVRQICLDPSRILDAAMNRARASVLFSATLTPPDYFADILGGGKGAVRISLPSPFDPGNLCLAAATGVSTRYEDREKSVKKLAGLIAAMVSGRAGNYIVYFPSYEYMGRVYAAFCERYPAVETVLQTAGMSASERESFLDAFADDRRLRVGFCVLGGSFSEGVDLPGGRLIGTAVVGVGLPGISNQRNLLREHYDATREQGYDYAYTYPGMNRVLQAAGRVIRREDDRGVVVLMDDRYASDRYRALFPEHWSGMQYAGNARELANIVTEFWKSFK